MRPKIGDIWYRFEDLKYAAPLDEYEIPVGEGRLVVKCFEYLVTKVTPCGVWLEHWRFVNSSSRKKFAAPTKEAARESFIARKEKQLRILTAQMRRAEKALSLAQNKEEEFVF